MDVLTAKKAIDWTMGFLGFQLTPDQAKEWGKVARDFESKEWTDAVKAYYRTREDDFPPLIFKIIKLIPGGESKGTNSEASRPWPKGWKEDPEKSYRENYIDMLKAWEKEDQEKGGE